jgi:ring-1,2-phenylacetyl-CoA epoxidase subunit PaaB
MSVLQTRFLKMKAKSKAFRKARPENPRHAFTFVSGKRQPRQTRCLLCQSQTTTDMKDWPLWEVFIRSKQGLSHKHVGSLHAADAQMAIENARDVYTRRNEGVSIWVVESAHIHASTEDAEAFFDPANDKVYRHPTFYDLPDAVKHM